ncbi:MAG: WG repeat-containing protein [Bacteroidia bacterium]
MKKMLVVYLFAVSLYTQAQTETITVQPNWIKTSTAMGMGYIDTNGNVILNPEYEQLRPFGEVGSKLAIIVQEGYMGLIDANGRIVAKPKYQSITVAKEFNPNWLMVSIDGEFGFIDFEGNEVVPVLYEGFVPPAKPQPAKQEK